MSLNIEKIKERVASHFSDIQQVEDSVIRFTKKSGQKSYAVYYLDVAKDLPGTQENLNKYQDRVIGRYYFEGQKSLQWSNYLYFITSGDHLAKNEVRQAKELIERDRSYARKFVITEDELDAILSPRKIASADGPHASILSIWTDRLVEAGIDKAILSDDNMPARMRLIEASSPEPKPKSKPSKHTLAVKVQPFIRSLELTKYLKFPLQRRFDFGTANLIVGANGSGKTSLLEAIELFYCGRNKRNLTASFPYKLTSEFIDGLIEPVTDNRTASEFRNLNLMWYGQTEIRTNNLYQSFAQFNFLDTDAAVSLAESTTHLEEDLSKLLVGSDAAKTWHNIERVHEALSTELRNISQIKSEINDEIAALVTQIKTDSSVKHESDAIYSLLCEMISKVGWHVSQGEKESLAGSLVQPLAEMNAVLQQVVALTWTEPPVSLDGLTKYCRMARAAIEKIEPYIARLDDAKRNQKRLMQSIKRNRESVEILEQAKRLIDAGVSIRLKEQYTQQKTISNYADRLAGFDKLSFDVISTADGDITLDKFYETAIKARTEAEKLLNEQRRGYKKFSEAQNLSLNLMQELRQIADKILKISPKTDQCPLCHTQFERGGLAKHTSIGVDEHLEALGQSFLSQMREQENLIRSGTAVELVALWLINYCEKANMSQSVKVKEAVSAAATEMQMLEAAQIKVGTLINDLKTLESQGLSINMLEEISSQLRESGYPLEEFSNEAVVRVRTIIEQSMASSLRLLEDENINIEGLQKIFSEIMRLFPSSAMDMIEAVSHLKERLSTTERLQIKISEFITSFPWFGDRALAELLVEAESIRRVAVELQTVINKEKQANTNLTDSVKRKEIVESKLSILQQRQKRLDEAFAVLKNIKDNHSLEAAMKTALQENRASIEDIFSRIHSPAEFLGIGSSWTTLIRKDGAEPSLSQISTGQRAAFALSIFLSQNAQLKNGPPVILIDDPIAHIDDLNSLSFLDFLRELVLTSQRQIFFATASDKLATLFERKFDFLGPKDFRRFDLRREPYIG